MEPAVYHITVVEGTPFDLEIGINTGTIENYTPIIADISNWDAKILFGSKKVGIETISWAKASGYVVIDNIEKKIRISLPISATDTILEDHDFWEFEIIPEQEPYLYLRGSVKYIRRLT